MLIGERAYSRGDYHAALPGSRHAPISTPVSYTHLDVYKRQAMNRLNPAEKLAARTDAAGRVRFRLRPEGMWLIKAVHMVPAAADSQAKWASFWASLTFERPSKIAQSHKG